MIATLRKKINAYDVHTCKVMHFITVFTITFFWRQKIKCLSIYPKRIRTFSISSDFGMKVQVNLVYTCFHLSQRFQILKVVLYVEWQD